ncbi:hypothetical protein Efla_007368 [Eimeria flavescens]
MGRRLLSVSSAAAVACCSLLLLWAAGLGGDRARVEARHSGGSGDSAGRQAEGTAASRRKASSVCSRASEGGSNQCADELEGASFTRRFQGPRPPADPLTRGLELTRGGDPHGLRLGPERQEDANQAMLQLLQQTRQTVFTEFYSVRVHTRESRELEARLKGQQPVEEEAEEAEIPSLVQQTVTDKKGSKSVVSFTTSGGQEYLNEVCTLGRQSGGYGNEAAVARFVGISGLYCLERDTEVDFSMKGNVCIDGCGKELACYGVATEDAERRLVGNADLPSWRRPSFKPRSFREEYCVSSHTQKEMDNLCVKGFVARWEEPNFRCYATDGEIDYNAQADTCVADCGYLVPCFGQPRVPMQGAVIPNWKEKLAEAKLTNCTCEERFLGKFYNGCQTRTRLGKTCQAWNVQTPHQHADSFDFEHNYCRNPAGEPYIWCYTTDPAVRFDVCDPAGLTTHYLQPESEFSLEYKALGTSPLKAIRFFEDRPDEMSVCGHPDLVLSTGIELPLDPLGMYVETPQTVVEEGDSQKLVWSGFKLSEEMSNKQRPPILACICDFQYAYASEHPNGTCTTPEDFKIVGGRLRVAGPLVFAMDLMPTYETLMPFKRGLLGLHLSEGDRIDVALSGKGSSCLLRTLGRTFSVAKSFGLYGNVSAKLAASWINRAFRLEKTARFRTILKTKGTFDSAVVESLSVSRVGEYIMCWTGEGTEGRAVGLITKFRATGFDVADNHIAPYALSSTGVNESLFSLFVRYSGPQLDLSSLMFRLREAAEPQCQGNEVARSLAVTAVTTSDDSLTILRGSGLLLKQDESMEMGKLLHLCLDTPERQVFAGHATVQPFGLCETWQVSADGTSTSVPLSVHSIRLTRYSALGLHWLERVPPEAFGWKAEQFFIEGDFLKTLTFAVFEEGLLLYAWTVEDVLPKQVASLAVRGWVALTMDVTFDRCFLYVAKKSKSGSMLIKYDARDPLKLPSASPLKTTAAYPTEDLCCLVTIYEDSSMQDTPFVLALDRRSGYLLWFDSELQLVESRSNWQGLTHPMEYPCSLSCTPRGSASDKKGEAFAASRGADASVRSGDVYDCYIADRDANRLLHVEIDTGKRGSALVHEYSSLGMEGDKLYRPVSLVAYRYEAETLVLLLQEGLQGLDLLVRNSDGTTDHYNTMLTESVGTGIAALPFVVEVGDSSSGLGAARVVVYRISGEVVTMQIISLEATASAAAFTYSQSDWYTVGDEVSLEPVITGSATLSLFKRFKLSPNVADFAVASRIASVHPTKGTLTLSLSPVPDPTVEIKVVAQGVVDEITSTLTFSVACKSGHYMKDGMCAKCPVGTFNSLTLVKQSPAEWWGACKACKKLTSTVSEGSTSEEQCICTKGYYLKDIQGGELHCVPCPAGTWKDTVSNSGCLGMKCPANSSTRVTGATSSEDRKCACHPGFIYAESVDACIRAPQGSYSPGGYLATAISCPLNTTTKPEYTGLLTSLQDCFCNVGFEPARPERLADPSSAEYQFRDWLRSLPEYADIADSQVCVPCGPVRYKETVSSDSCQSCPTASYSSLHASTSKKDCNRCQAGYYETANVDIPCGQCPRGSFCVGSDPPIAALSINAGLKKACPENSDTVEGVVNDHPFKCVCLPGYAADSIDEDTGTFVCQAVEPGSFKDTQSNSGPVACPLGGKSESRGADSLDLCICSPGEYRDSLTLMCTACPKGSYCTGSRRDEDTGLRVEVPAVECPANMTTAGLGAVSSDDCVCVAGFYRVFSGAAEDTATCMPCPINTYKEDIGNAACRACAVNSGTDEYGATSASQCLCNGGYYYSDRLKQCTACRHSYMYCPGGSIPCTDEDPSCVGGYMPAPPLQCPSNTRITAGFDTPSSASDCLCDRGFAYRGEDEEGDKVCEPCPPGSYKSSVQDANCNGLCGSHATSLPGMQYQSQCFCESGTYYVAGSCRACPEGATCLGGLTEEAFQMLAADATLTDITSADHIKPFPQRGYFLEKLHEELEDPGDWHFLKCPVQSACLGNGLCSDTMTDYLCSECKPDFTNTFETGEICTRCPSEGINVTLCMGYYIGVLLFNIGMAYMNVAAGYNRRSIHSIVIKIASNFITCMSVLFVVDFEQLELPSWFSSLKSNVTEQISSTQKTHWMAVDCFLRDKLDLSYGDSFFYTMLFYALLPIVLPISATLIMFLIVHRAKHYFRHSTQRKLSVLQQTIRFNMTELTEQLRDKLEEDRLFLMFRYIPLPGETTWRRAYKFFEDMIPIYVTVLFFIYTSTTRSMLSLVDCTAIEFGDEHGSSYHLTKAMSVECELSAHSEFFKFAMLGTLGLLLWSIGIPLGAFLVLFVKRKNLNSKETRLKYGFLHNGFVRKYWYWETVAFARKLCILVISSVVLLPSNNKSAARVMITGAVAIAFNILHLRCQPFDKRSYLTLDRLENHSMAVWTLTTCTLGLLFGANFSGLTNIVLIGLIALPVLSFALEVMVSLVFAYFDNVRATRSFFSVPVVGRLFRLFAYWSERRKAREPMVMLDEDDQSIQLVAARKGGPFSRFFRVRNKRINLEERSYFLKVMAEALGFAVVHLKLDVIPGSFLEFALRLGLVFSKLEEDNQHDKDSLQALAGGDLSKLLDWTKQEEEKQQQRRQLVRARSALAVGLHDFYTEWEKKLEEKDAERREAEEDSSEEEEKRERIRDLEGGESEPESDNSEGSEAAVDIRLADLERLVSRMTAEEQTETVYLFDEKVMGCGIALSELYLSLLKLQLKSPTAIEDQFNAFREKKELVMEERAARLRLRNRKLKIMRDAVLCAVHDPDSSVARALPTEADNERMQQRLKQLQEELAALKEQLQTLKTQPDSYGAAEERGDSIEWLEETDKQPEPSEQEETEKTTLLPSAREAADTPAVRELFRRSASAGSDSGSDLSDHELLAVDAKGLKCLLHSAACLQGWQHREAATQTTQQAFPTCLALSVLCELYLGAVADEPPPPLKDSRRQSEQEPVGSHKVGSSSHTRGPMGIPAAGWRGAPVLLLGCLLSLCFVDPACCLRLRRCRSWSPAFLPGGRGGTPNRVLPLGPPRASPGSSKASLPLLVPLVHRKAAWAPLGALRPSGAPNTTPHDKPSKRGARSGQQQQQQLSRRERSDCLSLAGRVVACLPGSKFEVQVDAAAAATAAAAAAAAAAPASFRDLKNPEGLKGRRLICSLSGKLRINRVYVQLHDVVIFEVKLPSPTEGRIIFRVKERSPAAAAAAADGRAAAAARC